MAMALVMIVLLGAMPVSALAQNNIPTNLVSATNPYSAADQAQIDRFLDTMIQRMASQDDASLGEARRLLVGQFTRVQDGQGRIFLQYISNGLSRRLKQLTAPGQRMIVRLNAMIVVESVAQHQASAAVIDLVSHGLSDASPAVRYWAGKAVANLASNANSNMGVQQQATLLNSLKAALGQEQSNAVYQQLLSCLVKLNLMPGATSLLLDELQSRASVHARDPQLAITPILESLTELFQSIIRQQASNESVPTEQVRRITQVAYRYLLTAATNLADDRIDRDDAKSYRDMVTYTDTILRWTTEQLGVDGADVPAKFDRAVDNGQWSEVRLRTTEWQKLLLDKLGFDEADLAVQFE